MGKKSTPLTKEDLELQKLLLEVIQLRQPWWKKPAYILAALPTILAICSLLAAYSTGYFQAVATKLDNQRHDLEIEVQQFNGKKTALQHDNAVLASEKASLLRDKERLSSEKETLVRDKERLSNENTILLAEKERLLRRGALYESTNHQLELTKELYEKQRFDRDFLVRTIKQSQVSDFRVNPHGPFRPELDPIGSLLLDHILNEPPAKDR